MSDRWQQSDPLGAGLPRSLQEVQLLCRKLHVSKSSGGLATLAKRKFFSHALERLSDPPTGRGKTKRGLIALYKVPTFRRQRWSASFEISKRTKTPEYSLERNLLQEWAGHADLQAGTEQDDQDEGPGDGGQEALPDCEELERLAGPGRVLKPKEAIDWVAATWRELEGALDAWEVLADEAREAAVLALFAVATVLDSQKLLRNAADRIPRLAEEYREILIDSPTPLERVRLHWAGTCQRFADASTNMLSADAETVTSEQTATLRDLLQELDQLRLRLSEEAARYEVERLGVSVKRILKKAEQLGITGPDGAADLRDRWAKIDVRVGVWQLRAEHRRLGDVGDELAGIQDQRERTRDLATRRGEVSRRLESDDPPTGAEFRRLLEEDGRISNELREARADYSHYLSGLSEDLYPQISIPEASEEPEVESDQVARASAPAAANGVSDEVGGGGDASRGDATAAARDEGRDRERWLLVELQRVEDDLQRSETDRAREVDHLKREADARRQDMRAAEQRIHQLEQALEARDGEIAEPALSDLPGSWEDFLPWCNDHLPGNVVLAPAARKGIKKARYKDVETAARCLLLLADDARKRRTGGSGSRPGSGPLPSGIHNEPCGGDAFDFEFDGHTLGADWHLKCGGNTRAPSRCLRIYYCWDDDSRKYVVADMPAHRHRGNS